MAGEGFRAAIVTAIRQGPARELPDAERVITSSGLADPAQPLAAQGIDDAVAASLRDRLAALDRALRRLDDGSYGRSVRSGLPIPADRLDADPAAELTVEEAGAAS
jgi:DnaK suppressor protein